MNVLISDENCVLFDTNSADESTKILDPNDKLNQRDAYTYIKNQIIALNWRKDKAKRFGGNFAENKAVQNDNGQHWEWLAEHSDALFITEKLLNEVEVFLCLL